MAKVEADDTHPVDPPYIDSRKGTTNAHFKRLQLREHKEQMTELNRVLGIDPEERSQLIDAPIGGQYFVKRNGTSFVYIPPKKG